MPHGEPPAPKAEPRLPAGETLPEYDESPHTDAHVIQAWLAEHIPARWSSWGSEGSSSGFAPAQDANAQRQRELISDVIGALLATGDATIVKNGTYRLMRRDGAEIERLAAGLAKLGLAGRMAVKHDGNPVSQALESIEAAMGGSSGTGTGTGADGDDISSTGWGAPRD